MTPSLCKLAHVALATRDLDRSLWFFRDLLGMEEVEDDGSRTYLRCWGELDHHSISLREGPAAVDHIAFRVGGADHLAAFVERLSADGVTVEQVDGGEEAGQGDALRFTMPHAEIPLELVWALDRPQSPEPVRGKLPTTSSQIWGRGASPRRLDHVNVQTAAAMVEPADAWAQEQLGFKRREYVQLTGAPMLLSFLSVTPQVHDIGIGADAQDRPGRFHHLAFQAEDAAAILRAADIMRENEIQVDLAPGRHGIGQSYFYYVRDPGSGHRVELCAGGYMIHDPDWQPVIWEEGNIELGLVFSGPSLAIGQGGPMDETTPCGTVAQVEAASA